MRVTVRKWGNSASVRIPAAIMEAANLAVDTVVAIREEGGSIIIERIESEDADLQILLGGITPSNVHDEVDFGPARGKEWL